MLKIEMRAILTIWVRLFIAVPLFHGVYSVPKHSAVWFSITIPSLSIDTITLTNIRKPSMTYVSDT